ncbi:abortive infection family protein [Acinetobacter piscicola]|uniref:abortive infection family protein n=1 Tax=Acinetobacter piscicola TaxID=2006115 RepID=UPI00101E992C|nr:abortive infection family protein [Acinetobacter piscicola]RYL29579.1 abortive infection protein [Acinetobacter piscicola]
MKKSRELIFQHSSEHLWLQDLEKLLNQIDQQANQCGDTLIECSKSFIEAIAKNIILKLKPDENPKEINLLDLGRLFKKAKECIFEHSAIENVMPRNDIESYFSALNQWIRFLGEMRNNIGEVSHGKILPKNYSISIELAQIIAQATDRLSYILLLLLLQIDLSYTQNYRYEEFIEFNDYLDDQHELPNSLSYSRALFEQDYDAYAEELDNYLDAQSIKLN